MKLFGTTNKNGTHQQLLDEESLISGLYTTDDTAYEEDKDRINLGAQPSPAGHTWSVDPDSGALVDMTPTTSNPPHPHSAAEIEADLAAAEAGRIGRAPPLLPAPTGIESEGPDTINDETEEENSHAQTDEAQGEDGESVPLIHVDSGPIDLDSGAPAIVGTAVAVPARQKVPNLALEQAGVVEQEPTEEELLEQQSFEFSLEDDNSLVRNIDMEDALAFGAETDTEEKTRRPSLKSTYSFESSLKSLDDTFLKDAKIPNPDNYRRTVSQVPSQPPPDATDAAETAQSIEGGSKKSSRIPGFVNAWNLLRAGRRSSNASLESSCVQTRIQDTSIDSDYVTARSPRRPGHASVSDAEQPSNPRTRRPESPPPLRRSTSQKVPSSPLSQQDSLSDKDFNKTFEADDDLESDSQSDGLGQLEDVHRYPQKSRRRCRMEILLLVLIAVLFLSVTIAIVSAVAITENNRAVSGVVGSQVVDRPLTGGQTPVPSLAPTSQPSPSQTSSPTLDPTTSPTASPTQTPTPGPSSSPTTAIQFIKVESAGIVEYSCQTQVVPTGYSSVQFQRFVVKAEICVNGANAIERLRGITFDLLENEIFPKLAEEELGNCHTDEDLEFTELVWDSAKTGDLNGFRYLGSGITCFDWENIEFQLNYFVKLRRHLNLALQISNLDVAEAVNTTLISIFSNIDTRKKGLDSLDYSGITNLQENPTTSPTLSPSTGLGPSHSPTTGSPTMSPSMPPSVAPTILPTSSPTSKMTSLNPTQSPTHQPSVGPATPTSSPTERMVSQSPTSSPTHQPSMSPTFLPTSSPTSKMTSLSPTSSPAHQPSVSPATFLPTSSPTHQPSSAPTVNPTSQPSRNPTKAPSLSPTRYPTTSPTSSPSLDMRMCENNYYCMIRDLQNECCPTEDGVWLECCTHAPTGAPSASPSTHIPTGSPVESNGVSGTPTMSPSNSPTSNPTYGPSRTPTLSPTGSPSQGPSKTPSVSPTGSPTVVATTSPSMAPSVSPTLQPSPSPTSAPTGTSTAGSPAPTAVQVINTVRNAAGPSTLSALEDPTSPQSAALNHVSSDPNAATRGDFEIIQEFALLCFAFETIEMEGNGGSRLLNNPGRGQGKRPVTSWPSDGHEPCEWLGVFCNYLGRVIAINVAQRGLPGKLVPEWALLKDSLQLIDTTNNRLTGQIPDEYGELRLLRWFRVSLNQITGNIPSSFANLKNLMQLYVQHNRMSGPFPNQVLSQMTGLTNLRIYFNQFSGKVDTSVCMDVFEADCYLGGDCVSLCWEA